MFMTAVVNPMVTSKLVVVYTQEPGFACRIRQS